MLLFPSESQNPKIDTCYTCVDIATRAPHGVVITCAVIFRRAPHGQRSTFAIFHFRLFYTLVLWSDC